MGRGRSDHNVIHSRRAEMHRLQRAAHPRRCLRRRWLAAVPRVLAPPSSGVACDVRGATAPRCAPVSLARPKAVIRGGCCQHPEDCREPGEVCLTRERWLDEQTAPERHCGTCGEVLHVAWDDDGPETCDARALALQLEHSRALRARVAAKHGLAQNAPTGFGDWEWAE